MNYKEVITELIRVSELDIRVNYRGMASVDFFDDVDIKYFPAFLILPDRQLTMEFSDNNKQMVAMEWQFRIRVVDQINNQDDVYIKDDFRSNNSLDAMNVCFNILRDYIVSFNQSSELLKISDNVYIDTLIDDMTPRTIGFECDIILREGMTGQCDNPIVS
jgi:hypothetical protein